MKRLAAASLVLMLALVPFRAVAAGKGDIHFGLKAGPSFSYTRAEEGRTNIRTTFAGGVFMSYSASTMFQIQPEVLYMGRGWKEVEGSLTLTNKISYIDIDLLFKLAIPSQGRMSSSIGIGPYVGLKISDGYEFNMAVPAEIDAAMEMIYDNLKSYDVGIAVAGELDIALENGGMILFDIRLTTGLQDIFEDIVIEGEPVVSLDMKNTGFQILAGYAF